MNKISHLNTRGGRQQMNFAEKRTEREIQLVNTDDSIRLIMLHAARAASFKSIRGYDYVKIGWELSQ